MGRDAYLARVALGRSAFGPPLKDENGELFLGGQARLYDDKSYIQQWDERGHPINPASEAQAKQYRKAQNEVLEACGVIIRKDSARKLQQSAHELTDEQQAEILAEENRLGFMLKCFDRFAGNCLTWWISSLRGRLLTFTSLHTTFSGIVRHDFQVRPVRFLVGGFLPWIVAEVGRLARRSEISEPIECMNYLQFNLEASSADVRERVYGWAEWASFLMSELPFEFASTLQALGFSVVRPVWYAAKRHVSTQKASPLAFPMFLLNPEFQTTVLLYLLRDYLYYQIGWRTYGLFRQLVIRPGRPTRLSVKMAEDDEFVDDDSIIGIGRKLGTYSERRFYGPNTFWSALSIAFPWLCFLSGKKQNREEIKKNVLSRCKITADIEGDVDARTPHSRSRAQNIIRNLESLGVDIEHDFYVDIDQWTREIDDVQDPYIPITEGHPAPSDHQDGSRRPSRTTGNILESFDFDSFMDIPPPELGITRVVSIPQTASPLLTSPLLTPPREETGQVHESEITPRPMRRLTETIELDADEEARLQWITNSQKKRRKKQKKDKRDYRTSRLTVFAAESFAWHASSLVASLVLWPIDFLYLSSLSGWFMSVTGQRTAAPMILRMATGEAGIELARPRQLAFVLLSLGLESVSRGILWQTTSRMALYYGRYCDWGSF